MTDSVVRRITWRTSDVARVLLLAILFLVVWRVFWMVLPALFIALIAVLIAIVLHVPSRALSRWLPFPLAFGIVLSIFLAGVAALLVAIAPQVVQQVSQLARQLPAALDAIAGFVESRTGNPRDSELVQSVTTQLTEFFGRFVPLAFNLISVFVGAFAVVILAVFLAVQPDTYRALLLRMLPPASRESGARVYDEAGRNLRAWVLGKVFTMLLVGVLTWVGLTLFGIPGALALAALAAVLEFIPTLGPTIAALPAVISAFLVSPLTALYVGIFYFGLQQFQNAITVPLVERRAVDIPPAALLIWQLMLAVGFGILGLFVATPLLALIVVVTRILYLEPSEERYAWDRRELAARAPAPARLETEAAPSPGAPDGAEAPGQ